MIFLFMKLSRSFKKVSLLVTVLQFFATSTFASLQSYPVKPETDFVSPRWVYDAKPVASSKDRSGKYGELVRARELQLQDKDASCSQELRKAYPKHKLLQPWIATVELECALENAKTKENAGSLYPSIQLL